MEFEERNKKPQETAKNLPMAVLITLVGVVCLLLYVGWQMISDDASTVSDLDPQAVVVREDEPIEAEVAPEVEEYVEEETSSSPVSTKNEDVKPVAISGAKTATHKVTSGETLFSIASRYNLSLKTLQSYNNNVSATTLKVGQNLTVPVMEIHTVGPGDILRVVGGKYGVTVAALMKANGKTKNFAERGEKLIIPFKETK